MSAQQVRDGRSRRSRAVRAERETARALLGVADVTFAAVFERNPSGFILGRLLRDGAGVPVDASVLWANAAFAAVTGSSGPPVPGAALTSLFATFGQEWLDRFAGVLRSGEPLVWTSRPRPSSSGVRVYMFPVADDVAGAFVCEVRADPAAVVEPPAVFGRLTVDFSSRRALLSGREVPLSAREFDVLAQLARSPGVVVPGPELLVTHRSSSWSRRRQSVDVHVSRLRRKLGESASQPRFVVTVRGFGYLLDPSGSGGR